MAKGRLDAERRANKGTTQLGDQILESMTIVTEGARKVPVEAGRMARRADQFAQPVAMEVMLAGSAPPVREDEDVARRHVEGPHAAKLVVHSGRRDQLMEFFLDVATGTGHGTARKVDRKSIALRHIEQAGTAEQTDRAAMDVGFAGARQRRPC